MPRIHAIVHTIGAQTAQGIYIPLEVAYQDFEGETKHFLINLGDSTSSLLSDCETTIDVKSAITHGFELKHVQAFLRNRFRTFSKKFHTANVVFGYKGLGLQPKFLMDAGIGNIHNVDYIGVPPLLTLDPEYLIKGGGDVCSYHVNNTGKCALRAVQLIAPYVFNQNDTQKENIKESSKDNVHKSNFELKIFVKEYFKTCERMMNEIIKKIVPLIDDNNSDLESEARKIENENLKSQINDVNAQLTLINDRNIKIENRVAEAFESLADMNLNVLTLDDMFQKY